MKSISKLQAKLPGGHTAQRTPKGVLLFHVDDVLTGGQGADYAAAVVQLRKRLPFRKWLTGKGTFTGTDLEQRPDGSTRSTQERCAQDLKPIRIAKAAKDSAPASPQQVSQGRGLLGGLEGARGPIFAKPAPAPKPEEDSAIIC